MAKALREEGVGQGEGGWGIRDGGLGMGGMGGIRGRGMGNVAWGAGVGDGGEMGEVRTGFWERFAFVCLLFLAVIAYSYYL